MRLNHKLFYCFETLRGRSHEGSERTQECADRGSRGVTPLKCLQKLKNLLMQPELKRALGNVTKFQPVIHSFI